MTVTDVRTDARAFKDPITTEGVVTMTDVRPNVEITFKDHPTEEVLTIEAVDIMAEETTSTMKEVDSTIIEVVVLVAIEAVALVAIEADEAVSVAKKEAFESVMEH